MSSFYSKEELTKINFLSLGENVLISKKASIYSPETISIGDNVRIDDFVILSGNIQIGSHVHISAYSALYGKGGIVLNDFSGCSARTIIYSASDDFSGEFMIGAVIPEQYTHVICKKVIINKYVQLGANTIVMPGVNIDEGSVTGALSFVNKSLGKWGIYCGIPAEKIRNRSKKMLKLVKEYKEKIS